MLVKGRCNYLSLRRMQTALARSASLFHEPDEFDQLRDLAAWSKATGDGSLADLEFRPLPAVWDEVASDHGNCMGRNCPTYKECFYYRGTPASGECRRAGGQSRLVFQRSCIAPRRASAFCPITTS